VADPSTERVLPFGSGVRSRRISGPGHGV